MPEPKTCRPERAARARRRPRHRHLQPQGRVVCALRQVSAQGGSLARGKLTGLVVSSEPGTYQYSRVGEMLRCPWHGWEFDVRTGRSWCDPTRLRLMNYAVSVEPGAKVVAGPLCRRDLPRGGGGRLHRRRNQVGPGGARDRQAVARLALTRTTRRLLAYCGPPRAQSKPARTCAPLASWAFLPSALPMRASARTAGTRTTGTRRARRTRKKARMKGQK